MQTVQLLHVTDPHLFGVSSRELYGVDTAKTFRLVLAQALADGPSPDAIVVTGDIGDDSSAGAYGQLRDALAGCGAPVFVLPGNHDDPALMATLLDDRGVQYCGRARVGGWGLVMLDTHVPGQAHGLLVDSELTRLQADLRAALESGGASDAQLEGLLAGWGLTPTGARAERIEQAAAALE
jgi:Icc protein